MKSGTPSDSPEETLLSDEPSDATVVAESARSTPSGTFADRQRIGHYLLLDELGRGGMGVVYAAHDRKLDRKVAIKMLKTAGNDKLQQRLIREAKAMAKLSHPNVVSVYEIGEHEGAAFIVMEYVEGKTLRQWLAAAPRSLTEVVAAFMAAGQGLAAIHATGLIHRDFKPDNLMIRDSGQVLVMDLGIARDDSTDATSRTTPDAAPDGSSQLAAFESDGPEDAPVDLTRTGALLGSPGYMAAEQFTGSEVTAKTDQFSFCVSLWEALHGERPFAGSDLGALAHAVTTGKTRAPKHRDVPAALRAVLERGLRVDPAARFESMPALLDALDRAGGARGRVRTRLALAAGATAVFALALVSVQAWIGDANPPVAATPVEILAQDAPAHRQITHTGIATLPALSPDGDHLVHLMGEGFAHVDMRSGETHELAPKVRNAIELGLASDGSVMFSGALLGKTGVYAMPSVAAGPEPVSGVLPIFCRFPNRNLIASIKVPGKSVRLSDASGKLVAELPIESELEWLRDVACDPRNDRVVVLHSLGNTDTLELLELDGGPARVLFQSDVELKAPCFDETGETLYYLAKHDGQTNIEATRVTAKGDDRPVTRVVLADIDADTFSRADSGRIAYVRTSTVNHGIWRIGAHDDSLEHATRVVDTNAEDVFFAVSPDETQLAYVEVRGNLGRLMIRALAGEAEREVTRGDRLRHVAWSPDGQTLAFIAQYRGQAHVWTVPAAGGPPTVLKQTFASEGLPLAWAPSERIIYQRPENRNFGVLDPNTRADRPLLADQTLGWLFYPVAAPDGESVAAFWNREGRGIWAIDIEDGKSRLLTGGRYFPLGWSTDGRFIYLGADESSPLAIHRISVESAEPGQAQLWRTIDFGPRRRAVCRVLSTEELLCAVIETASDIWIAEAIE